MDTALHTPGTAIGPIEKHGLTMEAFKNIIDFNEH
jgi:hypothetical protein